MGLSDDLGKLDIFVEQVGEVVGTGVYIIDYIGISMPIKYSNYWPIL